MALNEIGASDGGSRTPRAEDGRAVASGRWPQQLQCWGKVSGCCGGQRRLVMACVAPNCRVFTILVLSVPAERRRRRAFGSGVLVFFRFLSRL